ncbi:MAG: hypothetical protein ACREKH_18020, partial [Candidatus Rokuibacteriota bacterium]
MKSPKRHSAWLVGLAAILFVPFAAGCASPTKLARKSQDQLSEGRPAKAYETALKAARKESENPEVRAALKDAGDALLVLEGDRFRALLPHDTLAAAEVALRMSDLRYEMASFGVSAAVDGQLSMLEAKARSTAARTFDAEAERRLAAGDPKDAFFALSDAVRMTPDDETVRTRLDDVHAQATDHILVFPLVNDTRYDLSLAALDPGESYDLSHSLGKRNLLFTDLLAPDLAWRAGTAEEFRSLTPQRAMQIGGRAGASRVLWGRVYGDRLDTRTEIVQETVYRVTTAVDPEGNRVETWEAHTLRVATHDRWASAAIECEVYDVESGELVTRREDAETVGIRTVVGLSSLRGEAREYRLYPKEWETSDREACRARDREWQDRYGELGVSRMIELCGRTPGVAVLSGGTTYGEIVNSSR